MRFLELFHDWEDVLELDAQTIIFSEQDPADVMYFIISGEIDLTLDGKTLGTEREGGIFGEMAINPSAVRSSTATTITEVKLVRMSRDQFRECIRKNTDFSLHVMAVLANRLRAVDNYIATQLDGRRTHNGGT